MANKNTEFVVTNQIGSLGNENVGVNKEIQKLRQQMIEMHRAWANGLLPPPFSVDNPEYLSNFPLVSYAQFPILVDTPQHASGPTLGQQYPNTSNIHFLTPQYKITTCSAPPAIHAFAALLPFEAPTFNVNPTVVIPHSTSDPVFLVISITLPSPYLSRLVLTISLNCLNFLLTLRSLL